MIGKRRDDDPEVGELKRVVGSFLQILDSYPRDQLVVAATNHEGLLDEALWRRFDDVLVFPRPTVTQLTEFLAMRLRGVRKTGSISGRSRTTCKASRSPMPSGCASKRPRR